jgi:multiple sugar transport system substrate-binding protein
MIEKFGDSVDDVRSKYLGFAVNELTYQGKLYGLPTEADTRALYYNVEMMQQAGIDLDELNPENGALTVDRVREISEKLTKKDGRGNYTQLGLIPWDGEGWGYTWSLGKKAKFFDNDGCAVTIDTPEALAAYEYLYGEARRMQFPKVDAFKATYEPPNHPPAQTSFYSGKQGFMISGPFFQFAMRKYVPKLKFGVTYLPAFEKGDDPYTWSGGFSIVCPKGSSLSKDVWEFMKFYTSRQAQEIYMPRAYTLPTNKEVLAKSTNPVFTKDLKFFIDLFPYSTSRPPFPVSQLWWDSMSQAQQNVMLGSRTAKGALEAAQARVAPQMGLFCPFQMPKGYGTVGS